MQPANAFPQPPRITLHFVVKHLVWLAILSTALVLPAFGGQVLLGAPSSKAVLQISAQVVSVLPSPSFPATTQPAKSDAIRYEFSAPSPLEVNKTILVISGRGQSLSDAALNKSTVLERTTIVEP